MAKRILVDVTHPAHVHFFRPAMNIWRLQGYKVIVAAREKDVTINLLQHYGFEYHILSKARRGFVGLAAELIEHEARLTRLLRKTNPDVILEIGGTFIVHAAVLTRTPAIVFSDTEHATVANRITYPFATQIVTPGCYKDDLGQKHVRYEGYQELAYLHPNYFKPDPSVLDELGVAEGEPYSVVRLVSWAASHDRGQRGLPAEFWQALLQRLEGYGRVFISAESELPGEFEPYRLKVAPHRMHDILAYAQLYLGEGATMASEAAILGTPAVYVNPLSAGSLEELETTYGLVFSRLDPDQILSTVDQLLQRKDAQREFHERRKRLLTDKVDSTRWLVNFIDNYL